jgi:ribonucleoside-triphosphate reductase
LNFSLLATPAEGLSGRFVKMDKKRYGVIEGVTDREYYTNSFHVPVYFNINAFEKLKIEAPYHALTNAGHISYIELDGDPLNNLTAFEKVVRYMKEVGIGYGSINHPVDRDPVCGYTGIIGDKCPKCGRTEAEHNRVCHERIPRLKA